MDESLHTSQKITFMTTPWPYQFPSEQISSERWFHLILLKCSREVPKKTKPKHWCLGLRSHPGHWQTNTWQWLHCPMEAPMKSMNTHHLAGFTSGGYFHYSLSVFLFPKFPEKDESNISQNKECQKCNSIIGKLPYTSKLFTYDFI